MQNESKTNPNKTKFKIPQWRIPATRQIAIMQNKANLPDAQIDVTSFGKRDYDDFAALRLWKNKPNSKPNAGLWPEIRSTKYEILKKPNGCVMAAPQAQLTEYDFAKQSQFPKGKMNASFFFTKDYEKEPRIWARKKTQFIP